ncbi:hypothetical protein M0E87_04970 [Corynebacterium sp. CCM 9185]|uniref:Uncharacterized protein n=1 Tax=Corynebacterium marambiense TaxID=2765364 RepID=A0ABS0VVD8_9CORY|nr:hypothetical protein [Corynebacterium marambiense]MBI9000720.1 hypothetical protein [Corynebacterium marambiense]MCK7663017.1 hypothetical protein [Corynebacterium marambiense]MCX7542631.1 hypothetical protein [Corynebacterium marambiense]
MVTKYLSDFQVTGAELLHLPYAMELAAWDGSGAMVGVFLVVAALLLVFSPWESVRDRGEFAVVGGVILRRTGVFVGVVGP